MLTTLLQDLRYAVRGMVRQPTFAAVVLATLALGIGANTAIFSVVNGILLRPLPYPAPERIVYFNHEVPFQSVSEGEFLDYKRDLRSFERLAGFNSGEASLTGGDEPTRVPFTRVSADFFPILGTRPLLGRMTTPDDYIPGAARVVLMSHALWKRQFGSDSTLVGRDIQINGTPVTVIGILPERFGYPRQTNALWTAMRLHPDSLWGRNNHYMNMIGRLAPGASVASASAEARSLAATWKALFPETYGETLVPRIVTLADSITGGTRPFLIALLGAVGFVLLIACVNVANLFLVRGEARRREIAIRSALGASPSRLSAQFIAESFVYAVMGGSLGVALALGAQRLLLATAPSSVPRLDEVQLDGTVLVFSTLLVLVTGVAFGVYPAFRVARSRSASALHAGGRTGAASVRTLTLRLLVAAEVSLAVMMLGGAGMMLRSLWKLQSTELGFQPENVMTAQVSLPVVYAGDGTVRFFDELTTRLASTPGVVSAAAMRSLPILDGGNRWSIMTDGIVLRTIGEAPSVAPQQVTPGLLGTLRIPIVAGRPFTADDREGAPPVALVNEAMARLLWKGNNPVGRTIKMMDSAATWATIVGLVKDTRDEGLVEDVPPTMYFPHAQANRTNYSAALTMSVVVRTSGDPWAVVPHLRSIIRELDPRVPVSRVQSLTHVVEASIANRQFSTSLLSLFAAMAVLLAGIGIYGVISFAVSQRTHEIGVRVALGAQRSSVTSLVLKQSLSMTMIGALVGLAGVVALARIARSMLVGVDIVDPVTLLAASLLIVAVALAASAVPLRRALRVDPIRVLRSE